MSIYQNELQLTRVLHEMEYIGTQIDIGYTRDAYEFETSRYQDKAKEFYRITGVPFVDSNKSLSSVFSNFGIKPARTAKGNPSFTSNVLEKINHPLAKIILEYRDAFKRANTYYANFLQLCDSEGNIHCNFKQGGTVTGRMSCANPNLQNLTKEDEENPATPFKVRKCFVPREDYIFVMIDYDQMEYRLMLEYAKEMGVIEQVLGGMDIHQATANLLGVSRKFAKTINFMLLYGGGPTKLAETLGISLLKAKDLRGLYFSKLPKIERFIYDVQSVAKRRGYIINWYKRHCYVHHEHTYAAPNYLIQGGCADIVKKAMVSLDDYLRNKKSRILLQIHDEILFEVHKSEIELIPKLQEIMSGVYPHKFLPLTCGVEWSDISWQDKKDFSLL